MSTCTEEIRTVRAPCLKFTSKACARRWCSAKRLERQSDVELFLFAKLDRRNLAFNGFARGFEKLDARLHPLQIRARVQFARWCEAEGAELDFEVIVAVQRESFSVAFNGQLHDRWLRAAHVPDRTLHAVARSVRFFCYGWFSG